MTDGEEWKGIPEVGNRMSKEDTASMKPPRHGGGRSIQAWKRWQEARPDMWIRQHLERFERPESTSHFFKHRGELSKAGGT